MKHVALALGIALLGELILSRPASADCAAYSDYMHWVKTLHMPATARGVTIAGSFAYVSTYDSANSQAGLRVVDIDLTRPQYLQIVGELDLGSATGAGVVAVSGTRVYAARGNNCLGGEIYVIDVSDPRSPQILGSVEAPGNTHAVALSGDYAYWTEGCLFQGIQVVDISDPQSPETVAWVSTAPADAQSLAVSGSYAYVTTRDWHYPGSGSLQVIDIADPPNPEIVATLDMPGYGAGAVAVSGDYAYVSAAGLFVVDIRDPRHPQIVGSVENPPEIDFMALSGDYLYIRGPGCQVIDVSTPEDPRMLGSVDIPDAHGVAVSGALAYVPNGDLLVIDVANPHNPPITGGVDTPGQAYDVAVSGTHAYVADGTMGLQVVDITDPQDPKITGSMATPASAQHVSVSDSIAYVAMGGLLVVDITNPETPQGVGQVDVGHSSSGLAVAEPYAYISGNAGANARLSVIDVMNPEIPWVAGSVILPGYASGVAVSEDHAYVTVRIADALPYRYVLEVVDVASDRQQPIIVGSLEMPGPVYYVEAAGDLLCVFGKAFYVVDITFPTAPQIVGTVDPPSYHPAGLALSSTNAYAVNEESLDVIDITDPEHPRLAGSAPGGGGGAAVSGGYVYSVSGEHGLLIRPDRCGVTAISETAGSSLEPRLRIVPNPAFGSAAIHLTLPTMGRVSVAVYDVAGRRVRTLHDGILTAGPRDLLWDGRDDNGRTAGAGIYLARALMTEGIRTARIVIVR